MKKKIPIRNKNYSAWIKQLPCVVCMSITHGTMDVTESISEPHHENKKGHGTMGGKTDDLRTIPLCRNHHQQRHDKGRDTFYKEFDIDPEAEIETLNDIWEEANQIVFERFK